MLNPHSSKLQKTGLPWWASGKVQWRGHGFNYAPTCHRATKATVKTQHSQNTKTVESIKNKERLRNHHSQEEPKETR